MIIQDGEWTLFDYDIKSGRQIWKRNNGDKSVTFRTDYDAREILNSNAEARVNSIGQRYGDWQRIASIPLNLYFDQLAAAQSQRDSRYIDGWLSENDQFKTFR